MLNGVYCFARHRNTPRICVTEGTTVLFCGGVLLSTTEVKVKKVTFLYTARYVIMSLAALLCTTVPLVLSSPSLVFAASQSSPAQRSVIPNQRSAILQNQAPLHMDQASRMLSLSIALNLRNVAGLHQLIAEQNDRSSSLYHQYLTPQEFTDLFSPSQATVQSVVRYLRSQSLTITAISANRTLIDTVGTETQVEQTFHITLADYAVAGHQVYAPTSAPTVPASLAGVILNIGGLDDVANYHRLYTTGVSAHNGPDGGYGPGNLRTAYNVSPLISKNSGSGQTIAIFELDGYKSADIKKYLSYYNLGPAKYSNVLVDGATNTAGEGALEDELDLETVSAIAPGATQKVYIGPNSDKGVNDTYNQIVTDDVAQVVSTSWGECEADSGTSELQTLDNIFAQGASQGQAFFAASGDDGAFDCGTSALAVDLPASDPYVVGVGGTTLNTGNSGTYKSEFTWSSHADNSGGGGGISSYFSRPSYQTGRNLINAKREVPDISADADPNTGYSVYCTVTVAGCDSSGWITIGGTSAAAPLWAAIATDTNGYLSGLGANTLGSASTLIYKLYNATQTYTAYHDVTKGTNLYYPAAPGYDNATGIGSPDAWSFARDLASV